MVSDAVDRALPCLQLGCIYLLEEHHKNVEGRELFQAVPIEEVSQLVVFQDQVDFVLVHEKPLLCHEVLVARRNQSYQEIQQNDIEEVYLKNEK